MKSRCVMLDLCEAGSSEKKHALTGAVPSSFLPNCPTLLRFVFLRSRSGSCASSGALDIASTRIA